MSLGKRRDRGHVDIFWGKIYRTVLINELRRFGSNPVEPDENIRRYQPHRPTPAMIVRCDVGIIELADATRDQARVWVRAFILEFDDRANSSCWQCHHRTVIICLENVLHDIEGTETLENLSLFSDMRAIYLNDASILRKFDEYVIRILFFGNKSFDKDTTMLDLENSNALFSKEAIYRFFHRHNLEYAQERSLAACFALIWWKFNMDFITTSNYKEVQRIQNSDDANEASMGMRFTELIREFAESLPDRRRLYSMRKRCTQVQVDYLQTSIDNGVNPSSMSHALLATSVHEICCSNHMGSGHDEIYETVPVMLSIDIKSIRDKPMFVEVDNIINTYGMNMCCSAKEYEVLVLPGSRLTYTRIRQDMEYASYDASSSEYGVYAWTKFSPESPESPQDKCILVNNNIAQPLYGLNVSLSAAISAGIYNAISTPSLSE